VKLSKSVPKGTQIKVVKKQGKIWTSSGEELVMSNTNIANFIKQVSPIWPQYLVDKYQYILTTDSNFTLETDGINSDKMELD
jgi:hypothetical protein